MSQNIEPQAIFDLFRRDLTSHVEPAEALESLLAATASRAAGLWRLDGEQLVQLGFGAVAEMSLEVSSSFADATKTVSMTQRGLGIVQAAMTATPTVAQLDASESGLESSASWLARFEARASLAVPIKSRTEVVGVLAISSTAVPVEGDPSWELMQAVAARLGDCL